MAFNFEGLSPFDVFWVFLVLVFDGRILFDGFVVDSHLINYRKWKTKGYKIYPHSLYE